MSKQKALKDRPTAEYATVCFAGAILSFHGGFLNATTVGGFRGLSTAPMTGASTQIGINIAHGYATPFLVNLGIILCHCLGGFIGGYMVPQKTFHITQNYDFISKVAVCILISTTVISFYSSHSYAFYYLIAVVTGIQNSVSSR